MTREEIADEIVSANRGMHSRELADAVHALPVIATCGECGWCEGEVTRGPWCERDPHSRAVDRYDAPPSWCPLRGVAR